MSRWSTNRRAGNTTTDGRQTRPLTGIDPHPKCHLQRVYPSTATRKTCAQGRAARARDTGARAAGTGDGGDNSGAGRAGAAPDNGSPDGTGAGRAGPHRPQPTTHEAPRRRPRGDGGSLAPAANAQLVCTRSSPAEASKAPDERWANAWTRPTSSPDPTQPGVAVGRGLIEAQRADACRMVTPTAALFAPRMPP